MTKAKRRLDPRIYRAAAMVRKALAASPEYVECPRCDGKGFLDREDWIVTETDGRRVCFRCKGARTVPHTRPDPFKVRYAVAAHLLPLVQCGDVAQIRDEQRNARTDIYWPILCDVYARAIHAARRTRDIEYWEG